MTYTLPLATRVKPSVHHAFREKAQKDGLSINQAVKLLVLHSLGESCPEDMPLKLWLRGR